MPSVEDLSAWLALEPGTLLRNCVQSPLQGPGPGGQKRNRVYSGVRLRHAASGLSAEASERREARRNLEDALHRLRLAMVLALPVPEPESADAGSARAGQPGSVPIPPVPGGIAFRPGARATHADFPRLALAALLALELRRGRLAEAAAGLGCSASALTRFLALDKRVWARALESRKRNGLHALKPG
jgi:hypothetical protein